jgi:hypothetical protein
MVTKGFDNLVISEFQQTGALLNNSYTERREHTGILDTDHATTNDDECLR